MPFPVKIVFSFTGRGICHAVPGSIAKLHSEQLGLRGIWAVNSNR